MSNTSRNNSSTSLMGFSVHQPSIGSPLQFFPAMGSKQLDEMIGAYVPGNAPIADKRATVSMEFFEHSMATGELFKFFMVYPSLGSVTESPSSSMLDSGYGSSFTSPVMSESQWMQAGSASLPSGESKVGKPSTKKMALSNDFSHLPGMKIITKDGKDVTNMTSRGCKTKEQRDHAHLMRIIKACDSCRRKKVRCDPSHKRSSGSSSTAKVSKKTRKTAASTISSSAPPPQQASEPLGSFIHTPSFNISDEASSLSFNPAISESLVDLTMDWNQFIQFDEEPTEAIPSDYDFFHDPQGFLSPTSYNSFSPSQPITPAQTVATESMVAGAIEEEAQLPLPPYLNPGGEAGSDYADFDLYSPGSSTSLEDDPSLSKEVSAMPLSDYFEYPNRQRLADRHDQEMPISQDRNFDTQLAVSPNIQYRTSLLGLEQGLLPADLDTSSYYESISHAAYHGSGKIAQDPEWHVPISPGGLSPVPPVDSDEPQPQPQPRIVTLPTESDVRRIRVDTSMTLPNATSLEQQGSQSRSPLSYTDSIINRSIMTDQQRSVAVLTSGAGTWSTMSGALLTPSPVTTDSFSSNGLPQKYSRQTQSMRPPHAFKDCLKLRHSQKPVHNEMVVLCSPLLEGYGEDATSPYLVSSSQPTQPKQCIRNTTEKTTSTYMVERGIGGADESNNFVDSSTADLAAEDITIPSVNRQGDLGGSVSSASILGAINGVLDPAVAMTALYVLSIIVAISTMFQWEFLNNIAEKFETTPASAGYPPVVPASTKLRQRTTEHADTLDLSARPLSFLRRLPFAVTDSIKSKYSQLSGSVSRIHCHFETKYSFQTSGEVQGMRRLQCMTSTAW
ncbi:hypothetical protein F4805DRAFT_450850 [Annulohypoxylon moriforme]|nr:hypothetical protein F4805DRAFT_450850 [Annulohypoxylon moriforme]